MKEQLSTEIKNLLKKIDLYLSIDRLSVENTQVSPINSSEVSDKIGASDVLLTKDLDIENLSEQKITFFHMMSHFLFNRGNAKGLEKQDIVNLHEKLSKKLKSHNHFDRLDNERIY